MDEVEFHPAWHELLGASVANELHSLPWREPGPGAHVARGAAFMCFSQAEAGVGCPISMTYSIQPALRHQPELAEEWEPRFMSDSYDPRNVPATEKPGALAGMGMTEKQGGSDVRANTTVARPLNGGGPGAEYEITGHKWFFSAPMCDAFLVLAQAEGGISCFLFPRWTAGRRAQPLPPAAAQGQARQPLQRQLGDRVRRRLGPAGRRGGRRRAHDHRDGQPHPARLRAGRRPAACGPGLAQAINHASGRATFGKTLVDWPLMQNVLADLAVESEAATIAAMRLARAYDESIAGDEQAEAFKRISNAVLKYWTCKRGPSHAVECLECLGGNGYVEESGLPRLYREVPLASIWEGSGNVQCLDVLRAMVKSPDSLEAYFAEVAEGASEPRVAAEAKALRAELVGHGRDRGAGPAHRRAHGAAAAGLAAGPLRRRGRRGRLLRLAAGRRLGPRLRHAARRHRLHPHHRPPPRGRLERGPLEFVRAG